MTHIHHLVYATYTGASRLVTFQVLTAVLLRNSLLLGCDAVSGWMVHDANCLTLEDNGSTFGRNVGNHAPDDSHNPKVRILRLKHLASWDCHVGYLGIIFTRYSTTTFMGHFFILRAIQAVCVVLYARYSIVSFVSSATSQRTHSVSVISISLPHSEQCTTDRGSLAGSSHSPS